jgi:hypothetical protein
LPLIGKANVQIETFIILGRKVLSMVDQRGWVATIILSPPENTITTWINFQILAPHYRGNRG